MNTNFSKPTFVFPKEILIFLFIFFVIRFLVFYFRMFFLSRTKRKIKKLASTVTELTPEEFFELRTQKQGSRYLSSDYNFAGVYILYNKDKSMYYVGQAKSIFSRVNNHFTGKGNGDVYADYKYGDRFTIKLLPLKNSGFSNLNDLEREAISTYNSYAKGYNKTRGNK